MDVAALLREINEPKTVRLVATGRLVDPVLKQLVNDELLKDLEEIEGVTSGRRRAQEIGTDRLDPRELVYGVPHRHFINAAFSYWRPKALNRFNGPGRGAWYAALEVETAIEEVSFHLTRELAAVNDFNASVDYSEMFASFIGEFVDLRTVTPALPCLDPKIEIGYPEGNKLAAQVLAARHNGIVYPSVRRHGGTCLVALLPHAVQFVRQGRVLRLKWAGSQTHSVTYMTA